MGGRFASRLRELRTANGWTRYRLTQACGVSEGQLGKYEKGDLIPTEPVILRIATGLSVAPDELLSLAAADKLGEHGVNAIRQAGSGDVANEGAASRRRDLSPAWHGSTHPPTDEELHIMARAREAGIWSSFVEQPEFWAHPARARLRSFRYLEGLIQEVEDMQLMPQREASCEA